MNGAYDKGEVFKFIKKVVSVPESRYQTSVSF